MFSQSGSSQAADIRKPFHLVYHTQIMTARKSSTIGAIPYMSCLCMYDPYFVLKKTSNDKIYIAFFSLRAWNASSPFSRSVRVGWEWWYAEYLEQKKKDIRHSDH